MTEIHDIDKITKMYGGIAYEEISDKLIEEMLINKKYDTDLKSDTWVSTNEGHARRIAGIIHQIWQGTIFTIEMFYHALAPYCGVLYDGNYRLRAYQYLYQYYNYKKIPCYIIEEPFYPTFND